MPLALFELHWGEMSAMVGLLVTLVSGLIVTPAVFWLRAKFVSKRLHYHDKDEIWSNMSKNEDRIQELEQESKLAKQPIMQMQGAVEEMKVELKTLVSTIGAMDKSVTAAIGAINTRVTVIEATKRRGSGGK